MLHHQQIKPVLPWLAINIFVYQSLNILVRFILINRLINYFNGVFFILNLFSSNGRAHSKHLSMLDIDFAVQSWTDLPSVHLELYCSIPLRWDLDE